MTIVLGAPGVDGLGGVAGVLREWQYEGAPVQLHPGDLGWFWRFGAEATAAAVRTWSRAGRILAVGLLDGPGLVRLAIAPDARQDEELARRLADDMTGRAVLPEGKAQADASMSPLVQDLLSERGWTADEPWTPLRRDLTEPVETPDVRTEVIGPERAHVRTAVQRASFDGSTFTDSRWHAMASGPLYTAARCLVSYDDQGNAVAAATVWSARPGRPGLLEPMGVHRDHRGHGHGTAITLAAAAALQELGSSSALVCTPTSNTGAIATYESAGFHRLPQIRDHSRAQGLHDRETGSCVPLDSRRVLDPLRPPRAGLDDRVMGVRVKRLDRSRGVLRRLHRPDRGELRGARSPVLRPLRSPGACLARRRRAPSRPAPPSEPGAVAIRPRMYGIRPGQRERWSRHILV